MIEQAKKGSRQRAAGVNSRDDMAEGSIVLETATRLCREEAW